MMFDQIFQRSHSPTQTISPQVLLFACWMLGWAVGFVFFSTLPVNSPVLLAYLLLMAMTGVWAVLLMTVRQAPPRSLRRVPHLHGPHLRGPHLPDPQDLLPLDKLDALRRSPGRDAGHEVDGEHTMTGCYFLCSDGSLVPIEDKAILKVIADTEREMLRRQ